MTLCNGLRTGDFRELRNSEPRWKPYSYVGSEGCYALLR